MKKNSLISSLKDVFVYMKNYMPAIIFSLVLAAAGAVLTIIGPDKIGQMTTLMQEGLGGKIDFKVISEIGIFLVIIYLASAVFNYVVHFIMATVTLKTAKNMRQNLSEKINCVPMSYFNQVSQGDVLSRITNDVMTLQQGLTNSLPGIISAAAQFVGCLVMMFVTEWRLALCVIGITFVGFLLLMAIMGHSQRYFVEKQESLGELNGFIEEMYSGHEVVRISRAGQKIKEDFDKLNAVVYDSNWKSQFLSGIMQPLMNVIGNIGYVAICVFGAMLALDGKIEFGVIISFILYVRLFTAPLTQIAQGMTNMQMATASARRIFDFLESEELSDENVRRGDVAGRVGGDEFIFFADGLKTKEEANQLAERLCQGMNRIYLRQCDGLDLSCSIGMTVSQDRDMSYGALLKKADAMVYRAKMNGKNQFFAE